MTETYHHLIDPKSVYYAFGQVSANGREQGEVSLYVHLRNVINLQAARLEPETNAEGKKLVAGVGIDDDKSVKRKRPIFDNSSVGIWLEIVTVPKGGGLDGKIK